MLTITKRDANRVDLDLAGSIDAEEMDRGLTELLEATEEMTHGRMFYHISGFEMPGLTPIWVKMGRLPKLFGLLAKLDRIAVVCDTPWIRTAAEIEGKVIPGLEIRAFEPHEKDEAEVWLSA